MSKNTDTMINEDNVFYAVAMRGMVAFPKMVMHFDIARKKSIKAIDYAIKNGGKIFLVAQKDSLVDDPKKSDLYKIGIVAEIRQILKMPDNKVIKLLVEGMYKASLTDITEKNGALVAKIKKLPTYSRIALEDSESEALLRSVKDVFEQYIAPLWKAYDESSSRVPMTDWYDTVSGRWVSFRHRTVQGGLFMRLLMK